MQTKNKSWTDCRCGVRRWAAVGGQLGLQNVFVWGGWSPGMTQLSWAFLLFSTSLFLFSFSTSVGETEAELCFLWWGPHVPTRMKNKKGERLGEKKGSEGLFLGQRSELFQGRQEGKIPKELTSAFLSFYTTSGVVLLGKQLKSIEKVGNQKQRWRCFAVPRAASVLADEWFVSSPASDHNKHTVDSWEMLLLT